jgi:Sulfotransferase family
VDLAALGRRWLGFWATEVDRALATRTTADPARFHDVGYEALVADPLGEVEWLYVQLGLELSGGARQLMRRWIGRHHHRGRGRPHRYSLADFGLDPAVLDRHFARYRQWVAAVTSS